MWDNNTCVHAHCHIRTHTPQHLNSYGQVEEAVHPGLYMQHDDGGLRQSLVLQRQLRQFPVVRKKISSSALTESTLGCKVLEYQL